MHANINTHAGREGRKDGGLTFDRTYMTRNRIRLSRKKARMAVAMSNDLYRAIAASALKQFPSIKQIKYRHFSRWVYSHQTPIKNPQALPLGILYCISVSSIVNLTWLQCPRYMYMISMNTQTKSRLGQEC